MPSFALPDAPINLTHPLGTQVPDRARGGGGTSAPRCPQPLRGDTPVPKPILRTTSGQTYQWGKCFFFFPPLLPKSKHPNPRGICRSPRGNTEIFNPAAPQHLARMQPAKGSK